MPANSESRPGARAWGSPAIRFQACSQALMQRNDRSQHARGDFGEMQVASGASVPASGNRATTGSARNFEQVSDSTHVPLYVEPWLLDGRADAAAGRQATNDLRPARFEEECAGLTSLRVQRGRKVAI